MADNTFDIHAIIAKGKGDVRSYRLPAGDVLIRPLTELEMEECEFMMVDAIKDPEVRSFIMDVNQTEFTSPEAREAEFKSKNMNYTEFFKATTEFMPHIAYKAMRDFTTDDFTTEDLKKVSGIRDLAAEVQRISGYAMDSVEDIENFR